MCELSDDDWICDACWFSLLLLVVIFWVICSVFICCFTNSLLLSTHTAGCSWLVENEGTVNFVSNKFGLSPNLDLALVNWGAYTPQRRWSNLYKKRVQASCIRFWCKFAQVLVLNSLHSVRCRKLLTCKNLHTEPCQMCKFFLQVDLHRFLLQVPWAWVGVSGVELELIWAVHSSFPGQWHNCMVGHIPIFSQHISDNMLFLD